MKTKNKNCTCTHKLENDLSAKQIYKKCLYYNMIGIVYHVKWTRHLKGLFPSKLHLNFVLIKTLKLADK